VHSYPKPEMCSRFWTFGDYHVASSHG